MKQKAKKFLIRTRGIFPHALPIGKTDWDKFVSEILIAYDIPDFPSYRQAIATEVMHLPKGTYKKSLNYFAKTIRRYQANQIAYESIDEIKQLEKKLQSTTLEDADKNLHVVPTT